MTQILGQMRSGDTAGALANLGKIKDTSRGPRVVGEAVAPTKAPEAVDDTAYGTVGGTRKKRRRDTVLTGEETPLGAL